MRRPLTRYKRASSALAAGGLTGLFVALLMWGIRLKQAVADTRPQFISLMVTPQLERRKPIAVTIRPAGVMPNPQQPVRSAAQASVESQHPSEPTVIPRSIDWEREGNIVAKSISTTPTKATDNFSPSPLRMHEACKPKESSLEWGKDKKRVGFAGVLPYVRLGKRCIVGLGFFGCTMGELPKPNGHLLDDMQDPDKLSSSVPDAHTCD
jgi:hypothetical protein